VGDAVREGGLARTTAPGGDGEDTKITHAGMQTKYVAEAGSAGADTGPRAGSAQDSALAAMRHRSAAWVLFSD
jgi:hypothetical protein